MHDTGDMKMMQHDHHSTQNTASPVIADPTVVTQEVTDNTAANDNCDHQQTCPHCSAHACVHAHCHFPPAILLTSTPMTGDRTANLLYQAPFVALRVIAPPDRPPSV